MLRPGQVVLLCALALLTVGFVMVTSAGMNIRPLAPGGAPTSEPVGPLIESTLRSSTGLYLLLSIVAMAAAVLVPVRKLAAAVRPSDGPAGRGPVLVLAAGVAAMLVLLAIVYVPGLGKEVNGARRWIRLGVADLTFQPSELAKWSLIVLLAWFVAARGKLMSGFMTGLAPALAGAGLVAGAVVLEDLGTGALIGLVASLLLLAGGARIRDFLVFVPVGAAGLALAVWTSPYRIQRLIAFLDPYADPQGTGYHMIQSMAAVAGGGGFGRGLGHGLQKFGYLPEDTTDFLFAVICEELGVFGAATVLALFGGLIAAGLVIIRREQDTMLKLWALGVVLMIGLQAIINLAVVTGLGPTKGIALPLVSSGGTGWILTAGCLGLLAAVDRTQPASGQPQAAAGTVASTPVRLTAAA